jgi:hypothetical protein
MFQTKPKHRKEMLERPIGFLFSAIQILVYDQYGRISFGIRKPDRRKKWIGDFGVAGMVPSKTDILKVARDENV